MASSTPQKGKPIPVKWLLPLSPPLGPGNDLSISTSLPILNISYKWVMEHMTFMSFFCHLHNVFELRGHVSVLHFFYS